MQNVSSTLSENIPEYIGWAKHRTAHLS